MVKILLVQLKKPLSFSMLESKLWYNKTTKKKLVRFIKSNTLASLIVVTFSALQCPRGLNPKFRSKLNHGFTNHGCLHCAVLKVLFGLRFLRSSKCLETN